jgi:hypothetical protein
MKVNGWSEFSALPGEILSEENLDWIVGGQKHRGGDGDSARKDRHSDSGPRRRSRSRPGGKERKGPGMRRGPVGTRID